MGHSRESGIGPWVDRHLNRIEETMRAEEEQRAAEAAMADELANLLCPEDVKAFGRRHGIPNFAEVVWNAGFFAGYRQRIRDNKEGVDRG